MSYKESKLTIGFNSQLEVGNLTEVMKSLGFRVKPILNDEFYGMRGYSLQRGKTEFIAFYHPERYAKDPWNSKRSLERASGIVVSQMTLKAICHNGNKPPVKEQRSLASEIVFNFKGIVIDQRGDHGTLMRIYKEIDMIQIPHGYFKFGLAITSSKDTYYANCNNGDRP